MQEPVLYSTGCARCGVLKRKLSEKGISYEEHNDEAEMLRLGFTEVPMLVADGKTMKFSEAVQWVNQH